jgi:hypothetical protein
MLESGKSDLSGVEKLSAHLMGDGAQQDALRGTSDEISDSLIAGEKRHGIAIGGTGQVSSNNLLKAIFDVWFLIGIEGALPGIHATAKGGSGAGGVEHGAGIEGGGGSRLRKDFDQSGFVDAHGNLLKPVWGKGGKLSANGIGWTKGDFKVPIKNQDLAYGFCASH